MPDERRKAIGAARFIDVETTRRSSRSPRKVSFLMSWRLQRMAVNLSLWLELHLKKGFRLKLAKY